LAGEGARSSFWCQIIADCTQRRVIVPPGNEFGARGAALLAAVGIGRYANVESTAEMDDGKIYRPRVQAAARYDQVYGTYRMLRDDLRRAWRHAAGR